MAADMWKSVPEAPEKLVWKQETEEEIYWWKKFFSNCKTMRERRSVNRVLGNDL